MLHLFLFRLLHPILELTNVPQSGGPVRSLAFKESLWTSKSTPTTVDLGSTRFVIVVPTLPER